MKEEKVNEGNNVLRILSELVRIPSYGQIGKNHPIIEYLKQSFLDCEIVEVEDKKGNVHLLIGVNHELKNIDDAIILSGHIDTVRETEEHKCDVTFDEDKLKGLGISDMKAFIATLIANLDYLKSLDKPVVISLTSDEETNLLGIEEIIREMKTRNIKTSMTIVGEPTDLDYYVSSRGNSIYVSIMKGIPSHSGTPELGINAIELQNQFLTEIVKLRREHSSDASICITHVEGGKSPSNIVPDNCSTCFGIRTSDTKVLDQIYKQLQDRHKEIGSQCEGSILFNVLSIPPFERREYDFLSQYESRTEKRCVDALYATEAGYFQQAFPDSEIVIYGPGNPDGIHEARESIDPNNLLRYEVELRDMLDKYLAYRKQENKDIKKLVLVPEKNKD